MNHTYGTIFIAVLILSFAFVAGIFQSIDTTKTYKEAFIRYCLTQGEYPVLGGYSNSAVDSCEAKLQELVK